MILFGMPMSVSMRLVCAQFDAVRQNQYALARIQNVPLRQFGEDDRLSASCWQLEQQIVAVRNFSIRDMSVLMAFSWYP